MHVTINAERSLATICFVLITAVAMFVMVGRLKGVSRPAAPIASQPDARPAAPESEPASSTFSDVAG